MQISVRTREAWWTTADTPASAKLYSRIMSIQWDAETCMVHVRYSDPAGDGTQILTKSFNIGEYDLVVFGP